MMKSISKKAHHSLKDKTDNPISLSYCVIIPTYNNAKTLSKVIRGVQDHTSDIIVVNDGSTDNTVEILSEFDSIEIITHQKNQGKGAALIHGFEKAYEKGFNYAITIDSDGQHDPDDIHDVAKIASENLGSVVMGSRNMNQQDVPGKSSFGNKFSSFWFWAETGIRLTDTQTGFRAYPLEPLSKMHFYTRRFEFEIESIVRLAWRNVKFVEQPVGVTYQDDRVSHFRPFKDFARISVLNTVLITLALLFFLPRLMYWNFSFSNLLAQVKGEFLNGSNSSMKLAGSVGLGFFFGVFPIWGFQMAVAFAVASVLRLNRIIVLASSNISIPPMIPLIVFASLWVGGLFVDSGIDVWKVETYDLNSIHLHLLQYLTGAIALSFIVGVIGFMTTWLVSGILGLGRKKNTKDV